MLVPCKGHPAHRCFLVRVRVYRHTAVACRRRKSLASMPSAKCRSCQARPSKASRTSTTRALPASSPRLAARCQVTTCEEAIAHRAGNRRMILGINAHTQLIGRYHRRHYQAVASQAAATLAFVQGTSGLHYQFGRRMIGDVGFPKPDIRAAAWLNRSH